MADEKGRWITINLKVSVFVEDHLRLDSEHDALLAADGSLYRPVLYFERDEGGFGTEYVDIGGELELEALGIRSLDYIHDPPLMEEET